MAVSNTQPSANRWSFLGGQSTAMQREGFDGALSTVDEQNEGVNRKSYVRSNENRHRSRQDHREKGRKSAGCRRGEWSSEWRRLRNRGPITVRCDAIVMPLIRSWFVSKRGIRRERKGIKKSSLYANRSTVPSAYGKLNSVTTT